MENEQSIAAEEKRRQQVYVDKDDALARVLEVAEADYQCVRVNGSWLDKGLMEGDIVLVSLDATPRIDDIVLLEEDGQEKLGIMHEPGWLHPFRRPPLERGGTGHRRRSCPGPPAAQGLSIAGSINDIKSGTPRSQLRLVAYVPAHVLTFPIVGLNLGFIPVNSITIRG